MTVIYPSAAGDTFTLYLFIGWGLVWWVVKQIANAFFVERCWGFKSVGGVDNDNVNSRKVLYIFGIVL